jgi:large subunit ribosomal protein L21
LYVHYLGEAVKEGDTVEFDRVLLADADGDVKIGAPTVAGAKVVCEVATSLVKGDKVIVFKKKRRKGYRRKNGHRQYFTKIVIKEVVA